ncbi:MAG: PD-(D/E)XK nuclease family protein [Chloroflexota bacterium]
MAQEDLRLRFAHHDPMTTISLSRFKLTTFLECQRRFQLRFLERLAWPLEPLSETVERSMARGQAFHQLLERHFLGLPVNVAALADGRLREWWFALQQSGIQLPNGRYLPELDLTTPLLQTEEGMFLLNGRFDLLIVGTENNTPFAHLFDWKTGLPRPESELRHDWQTRLYLAMLAESGSAILGTPALSPDQIAITYWYVSEPDEPRTIRYSQAQHDTNWADLQAIAAQISTAHASNDWPLTDNLTYCRHCAYQAYCGRQEAGRINLAPPDEDEELAFWGQLEPLSP